MQLLLYIIAFPFLWLVSKLPFKLLYALSDVVFVFVFYLIRYRRKTVRANLELTMPHLSDFERKKIEKKFYRHMCDMFLEMIKTLSITEQQLQKRFVFTNMEHYQNLLKEQKSIVLMFPHYASWEWVIALGKFTPCNSYPIYKRIGNKYFDKLIIRIRSKFGSILIDAKSAVTALRKNQQQNILGVYAFISDQTPRPQQTHFWENFMNVKVPIHTGAEFLAKKFDMNVVYLKIEKIKRGFYQTTFVPLVDNNQKAEKYDITKAFLKQVEKQIYEKPEYYFWTHKRWKYREKTNS